MCLGDFLVNVFATFVISTEQHKFTGMRKLLLDALKAKFTGVSEQVLGRIADKLAKTVKTEAEVATAVEGVTLQQVIDSYGDSRATEAQQTAVKNYESKYGLKDGAKVKDGSDPTPTATDTNNKDGEDNSTPAWAKTIIENQKSITDRLNKMDGERTATNRKQQLSTIIGKLPEALRKPYERIPLDTMTEDEFAALRDEVTAEVDTIVSETHARGAVFGRPVGSGSANKSTGGTEKEATDEEAKAVVDRLSI